MHSDGSVGALVVGCLLLLMGFLLTTRPAVARWALSQGRAQIWNRLLGEERALKLTRWFFGPAMLLVGAVCLFGAFVGEYVARHPGAGGH